MPILNYWTQFEHTGKVEDYLCYISSRETGMTAEVADTAGNDGGITDRDGEKSQAGANPYAGIYMCDRNHIETDSCGRV